MDNYEARVQLIGVLTSAFPSAEVTALTIKTYSYGLSDLSVQVLQFAIDKCIQSHKFSSLPTVAEIRENAEAVAVNQKDGKHSDGCACFGTNWIEYRDNGYRQVRRCDQVPDEVDNF